MSWLAVEAPTSEYLLQNLRLTSTTETAMFGESLFTGSNLPSGWFILVINQCEHEFIKPKVLESLSSNVDVVACSIEEHVMWSTAEMWRNGSRVWRIEHDGQKGISHISASGLLPDGYQAIERRFAEQQRNSSGVGSDTDYFFEVPLQTARSIVGFKHDESGVEGGSFLVFNGGASSQMATKPWWKFW